MIGSLTLRAARPLWMHGSLRTLAHVAAPVLLIAPSTSGALALAKALARARPCLITRGPITESIRWPSADCLRTAAELSHELTGQAGLPRTIISFPDQIPCITSTSVMVRFNEEAHAFSTLEALLVLRHRPRVFALSSFRRRWGMQLIEVRYEEAFDAQGRLISLGTLIGHLLVRLGADLADPPSDWLARDCLLRKSERVLWIQAREEMKDIECLLRMQLQSRFCDRERTRAVLAAVLARQKTLVGTALP
ncbi:MAG: hypothetical protein WDO56_35770 [Gammaproteobacteria bacterium]